MSGACRLRRKTAPRESSAGEGPRPSVGIHVLSPSNMLFDAGDEIFAVRRAEHEIEREPGSFGERVAKHGSQYGEDHAAVLQRIPRWVRPGSHHHHEKAKRQQDFHGDQIQGVGTQEVVRLSTLKKHPAGRAALLYLKESLEEPASATVGTPQQQRAPEEPPRRLTGDVGLLMTGHAGPGEIPL